MKYAARYACFGILILVGLSCRMAGRMVEKGVEKGLDKTLNTNRTDSLWPDVPRMDGLNDSPSEDLPMSVKLALHAYVDLVLNSDKDQKEHIAADWILFKYSGQATDITNFYTLDRMKSSGNWGLPKDMKTPCTDGEEKGFPGSVCLFQKADSSSHDGLIILALQPKETDADKTTFLYFLRAKGTPKAGQ